VTGINKGGLQVKVLGASAFCPASQVDVKYVEDLNVYLDRTMSFVITRIEEGGRKVVVSRVPLLEKELAEKLEKLEQEIPAKRLRSGVVTRIAEFGLFIDTGTGIDGLAHISEVSWARADNLGESFSVGQPVEYVVLSVERREPLRNTKIALSIKQAGEDPWLSAAGRFPAGTQVEGTVTRLAAFGAFVQLVPGVEGLIHLSELSWERRVNRVEDVVTPGQRVRVTVLAVDAGARRISCSLKDIADDPWKDAPQRFAVGSTVKGTVASAAKFGFFIDLAPGVAGLLAMPNIATDKRTGIKVGAPIEVNVAAVDAEKRRISLSLGIEEGKAEAAAVEAYLKENQPSGPAAVAAASSSEFADALKAALAKKK
jgi:small subunit ribosomal protein S1